MRRITSFQAFKTSYIAEVKEEMGLPLRRRKRIRRVKTPQHIKPIIRKAIESLGKDASYREIQKKAFEIYREMYEAEIDRFFGILRVKDKEAFRRIVEDEEIAYN
ncbi:hypothetical protein [Thermodesulfatator atlanticus]